MEIQGQKIPPIFRKLFAKRSFSSWPKKVTESVVACVKKAEHFSFSVDSTADILHTDQLTLIIIRYVSPVNGLTSERFLTFLELKDHSRYGRFSV